MNFHRPLPFVAAMAMAGLLSGCGGSGTTVPEEVPPAPEPVPPTPMALELPVGHGLELGIGESETIQIAAGGSEERGGVVFDCPGATPCEVTLTNSVGTLLVEEIGGATVRLRDIAEGPFEPGPDDSLDSLTPVSQKALSLQIGRSSGKSLRDYARSLRRLIQSGLDDEKRQAQLDALLADTGDVEDLPGDPNFPSRADGLTASSDYPPPTGGHPTSGRTVPDHTDPKFNMVGTQSSDQSSVTQSSTGHAIDMTFAVTAEYESTNRPDGGTAHLWSWRDADRRAGFLGQATWRTPDNEAEIWTTDDGDAGQTPHREADVVREGDMDNTGSGDIWGHFVTVSTPQDGGRTVHVDFYSDIEDKWADAPTYTLVGYDLDTSFGGELETTGNMHPDWRGGPRILDFDDGQNVKAPHELESGESEGFHCDRTKTTCNPNAGVPSGGGRVSVEGTYRGLQGTFFCVGPDGCHIRLQTGVINVRGDFQFEPNPGELIFVPDTDWLAVGVWHTIPVDPQGDYETGAFADGNDPFTPGSVAALEGTATYEGDAGGLYATKEDADSDVEFGRFTAKAALRANFGDGTDLGAISGEISQFMVGGESRPWAVSLEAADIGDDDIANYFVDDGDDLGPGNDMNAFKGNTSGHTDGHEVEGRWGGRFYGNGVGTGDANPACTTNCPGSVAGTFAATLKEPAINGYDMSLSGAFGAHRTAPSLPEQPTLPERSQ